MSYGGVVIGTLAGGTGPTPLTVSLNSSATAAAVTALARNVTYENTNLDDPTAGPKSVAFDLTDGDGGAAVTQDLTINVSAVNDQPVATIAAAGFGVVEDDAYRPLANFSISDVDAAAQDLEITLSVGDGTLRLTTTAGLTLTAGANDSATMSYTGSATDLNLALATVGYRPNADFVGIDTVTLSVDDLGNSGNGGPLSAMDSAPITVTPVNDAPVLDLDADDSVAAGIDFATSWTEDAGPVLVADTDATISDIDSSNLTSALVTVTNLLDGTDEVLSANTSGTSITASYDSATGVLTLSGSDSVASYRQVLRTVTYDNASDAPNATDRILTVVASDGSDASPAATSTISINPVNDAPTAVADADTVAEAGSTAIDLAANDSDVDNALDLTSIVITSAPTNGSLVNHGDGTVTYTHDGSETTSDTFTYTIADASGAPSNVATVTITITPENDVPAIVIGSAPATYFEEGAAVTIAPVLTLTDADGSDGTDPSNLYTAVVRITGAFEVGDVLGFIGHGKDRRRADQ